MNLKILLTGCAGYIGSHVAHLLIDKGHSVINLIYLFKIEKNIYKMNNYYQDI